MKKTKIRLDYAQMPSPPPAKFMAELEARLSGLNAYPDISYDQPRRAIANRLDLDPSNICLGNGADEIIDLISLTYGKNNIVIAAPTFGQYEAAAKRHGKPCRIVSCLRNGRFDLNPLRPHLEGAGLIWICNPNNPMGFGVDGENILHIAESTEAKVAVDEAYFEFYGQTLAARIKEFNNLIVVRTFSKGFGLAGIRAGYALAGPPTISQMNKVRQPFNLNYLASCAIPLALKHEKEFKPRIKTIEKTRDWFSQELAQQGYSPYPSKTNFLTIPFDSPQEAKKAFDFLESRDVIVLPPWDSEFTCMPPNTLRVTIGTPEQMRIVAAVLGEWMG